MSDVLVEIKGRLNIEDLVAQYVALKPAGRNFKGLCPFHDEKTPSFVVSPDKQIAYCFGCQKGGDIFKFFQELEGLEFPEAVRQLAEKTGVKLEDNYMKESKTKKDESAKMVDAHELAKDFYAEKLFSSPEGTKVLSYLKKRGLDEETIKEFELGYSPDAFQDTHEYLLNMGAEKQILLKAGLLSQKDRSSGKVFDRFRGRLMFPIKDARGQTVAFGGRALKKDDDPKYLNTAETPIYHKGDVLYGFDKAKQAIKKTDSVILVEGYMDLLMSHQAGVKHAVAVSGTALTSQHVKLIKRLASKLIFAFDTDSAGLEAAKRSFLLAEANSISTFMIDLEDKKDPADYVAEDAQAYLKLFNNPKPFIELLIEKTADMYDLNSIDGKKIFIHDLMPYLAALGSSVEQDFYLRMMATFLKVQPQLMHDEMKSFQKGQKSQVVVREDIGEPLKYSFALQEHILGLLLAYPASFELIENEGLEDYLSGDLSAIYKEFLSQYTSQRANGSLRFNYELVSDDLRQRAMMLLILGEEENAYLGEKAVKDQAQSLIAKLKGNAVKVDRDSLERDIKEAQRVGDKEKLADLMLRMRDLLQDI